MSLWIIWLSLVVLIGSGLASDVPFVFGENTSGLANFSSAQLEEASSSSPDLVGVPLVSSPSDNDVLKIPVTGGSSTPEGKVEKDVTDLKDELNKKVEPDNPRIRKTAVLLASKYPGDHRIDQIYEIYMYLKYGDDTKKAWSYVPDTRGIDSWNYANESLDIGDEVNCVGLGDCDDYAILMSALIESIAGNTRIILASNNTTGGHAYTEVYLGRLSDTNNQVEEIVEWLQQEFNTDKIYGHIDTDTKEVWLNLDWGPDVRGNAHPGGPLFPGDRHDVLRIREKYELEPLRMPEDINKAPRLISLTPDKKSPQEAGTVVTWIAKAIDADNDQILYRFFLNGDPVTRWITDDSWIWITTDADIGDNQIDVHVIDGKHAGLNRFDSIKIANFSIIEREAVSPMQGVQSVSEGSRTHTVNSDGSADYKTIGDAVAASKDGDIFYIKPGFYMEEISLNKNLELVPITGDEDIQYEIGGRTYILDDDGFANFRAINEAVSSVSNGDTIYIKPGLYNGDFSLNKNIKLAPLTGEGGAIILKCNITIIAEKLQAKIMEIIVDEPLPDAIFTYSPAEPVVGEVVTFDASQSKDEKGQIVEYEWDFDDGYSGKRVSIDHPFWKSGTYNVKLTVTNDKGVKNSSSINVNVSQKIDPIIDQHPVESQSSQPAETYTKVIIYMNVILSEEPYANSMLSADPYEDVMLSGDLYENAMLSSELCGNIMLSADPYENTTTPEQLQSVFAYTNLTAYPILQNETIEVPTEDTANSEALTWYIKGQILELLGRTTKADAAYAKAKELDTKLPDVNIHASPIGWNIGT